MTIAKQRTQHTKPSVHQRVYNREKATMVTTDGRMVAAVDGRLDARWRARINTAKIMTRLQTNALGRLQHRATAVPDMCTWLLNQVGVNFHELPAKLQFQIKNECKERIERMEMSMAQVRSAEVILKKVVPDLAQVEHKANGQVQHVVVLPQRAEDSAAWAASARRVIEHDPTAESSLATPTGAAEPAVVLPG